MTGTCVLSVEEANLLVVNVDAHRRVPRIGVLHLQGSTGICQPPCVQTEHWCNAPPSARLHQRRIAHNHVHPAYTDLVIARCDGDDLVAALHKGNWQSACQVQSGRQRDIGRDDPVHITELVRSDAQHVSTKVPVTSPRPPVFDQGPTSAETNTMFSGGALLAVSGSGAPKAGAAADTTERRPAHLHAD